MDKKNNDKFLKIVELMDWNEFRFTKKELEVMKSKIMELVEQGNEEILLIAFQKMVPDAK